MQDRFKFRIFIKNEPNPKYNGMFKVHSLHFGTKKAIISAQYGNVSIKLDNNKALMQSTGLKDKNGKLIYEGDIVKFKTELFGKPKQIIWDECHYILKNTFIILCDMEIKQFGLEVIGNIYENKELLDSKEK